MNKRADLAFLMSMLTINLTTDGEETFQQTLGFINRYKRRGFLGPSQLILDMVNPALVNNFIDGYLIARDKYGIEGANECMREKLTSVIMANDPVYPDEGSLYKRCRDVQIMSDLLTKGIHVTINKEEE